MFAEATITILLIKKKLLLKLELAEKLRYLLLLYFCDKSIKLVSLFLFAGCRSEESKAVILLHFPTCSVIS